MGLLLKLFGRKLTIRFEGVMIDGKYFEGKTKIEVFGVDKEEVEEYLKRVVYVETGKIVKDIKIIAAA